MVEFPVISNISSDLPDRTWTSCSNPSHGAALFAVISVETGNGVSIAPWTAQFTSVLGHLDPLCFPGRCKDGAGFTGRNTQSHGIVSTFDHDFPHRETSKSEI